ncbi:MAG: sodium:solute symporter family protein [Verrucomicrobia bacterium]|nr:sodium:solute symporter family protein [Verrucomicrobiota bacterium]
MNTTLFIISLLLLQGTCWWIGNRSSKSANTGADYYLGGRAIGLFPLIMTFFATQVGGGIVLGSAQEAYKFGWWVLFYPIGQVLGLLALGCGIGKRLAKFQVSTVAQVFEIYYRSPLLKKLVSLFSIVSLFMILAAQVIASKSFLTAIGVDASWLFYLFWALLISYTAMGGMKSVIATDLIQAFFFVGVFLLAFGASLFLGNPVLPENTPLEFSSSKINGWLFMPLLFTFIEQDMAQRCFGAKSSSILSKGAILAGLATMAISWIPVYFGVLGNSLGTSAEGSVLIYSVMAATSPWITSLVGCAVIAAIFSTANALINAVGSNLSEDFQIGNGSRSRRVMAILIGAMAILVSSCFNNVVDLLILSYELSVNCLIIPLLGALFLGERGRNLPAALASIGAGAAGYALGRFFGAPELFGIGCSAAAYLAVIALKRRVEEKA